MLPRWLVVAAAVQSFIGCRCVLPLTQVTPAEIVANPQRLEFPPTYLGRSSSLTLELTNIGGEAKRIDLTSSRPFVVTAAEVTVGRGETETVIVTFAPTVAGPFLGSLGSVELSGEGLEIPECVASSVCRSSSFDFDAAVCREEEQPSGTQCETSCVIGVCTQGTCVGSLKGCDDGDVCTTDGCSELFGCNHEPRVCPAPQNLCQVARCDSATGCGVEDAPDGTLCGADNCVDLEVDICITGQCQRRLRPATGRCANRWASLSIPGRGDHEMAWDAARGRMIVFGGQLRTHGIGFGDTWAWDGTAWSERTPVSSPSARSRHRMVYDAARQRIVLFGGFTPEEDRLGDTWEWDGVNWVQRTPAVSPPSRGDFAMAYDRARRRVVLFGGDGAAGILNDLWEWDGTTWTRRLPSTSPAPRLYHAMAYDEVRQRVVLFGGYGPLGPLADHWEWDGLNWVERTFNVKPSERSWHSMAWDGARGRVVLFSGVTFTMLNDTWEFDGNAWTQRSPATSPPARSSAALAYDGNAHRLLVFAGLSSANAGRGLADTWEWDGVTWTERASIAAPPSRRNEALAWDASRQRMVLFGGFSSVSGMGLDDTWELDGTRWTKRLFVSGPRPTGRGQHSMAYDPLRQRVVMFGGAPNDSSVSALDETWELDGNGWTQRTPIISPPGRIDHQLVWDSSRQRIVLFGGTDAVQQALFTDTWEWDGTSWTQRMPSLSPPGGVLRTMAFDDARQRAVLFGGTGSNETWTWDGTTWQPRAPPTSPPARGGHAMAYDAMRQRVLLYGGLQTYPYNDTWEWDGTTWSQRMPVTSPPESYGHAMAYDGQKERVVLFEDDDTYVFLP